MMEFFERPVMKISSSAPALIASWTAYWISGLSTMGSISLALALVAGRKRVPSPATGNTALRMRMRSPDGRREPGNRFSVSALLSTQEFILTQRAGEMDFCGAGGEQGELDRLGLRGIAQHRAAGQQQRLLELHRVAARRRGQARLQQGQAARRGPQTVGDRAGKAEQPRRRGVQVDRV